MGPADREPTATTASGEPTATTASGEPTQVPPGLAGGGAASARVDHRAKAQASDVQLQAATSVTVGSLGEWVRAWWVRARSGQAGALPVVIGLVVIALIFQTQDTVFLSARNLTNLFVQGTTYVLLGMAEVFVLLLGEIDLSVGYVAGVGAVVMAELVGPAYHWPWWAAMLAGAGATALIGLVNGVIVTLLKIPSFIVTLAGLLGWEGVLLYLVDHAKDANGGTIPITNNVVFDLVNGTISTGAAWIAGAVLVALFAVFVLRRDGRRRSSGLAAPPLGLTVVKIVAVAVAGAALVAICSANRSTVGVLTGVPWVIPATLAVFGLWTFLLGRTRFGRYIYAIGGNAEAARRAGISVTWMYIGAFVLASLTSGLAGIVYASRLGSISNNIDGGTLVLYAVAAAVIGGASLFGGRGRMIDALLGGVVIAAIYNGMGILGMSAAAQYMVTALVLLAAVTIDRLARRGEPGS
ncbi:MAG: ABC transporter permease [Actinomycetota bacterium]|jgi:D-xylose transport system permease protein|nr:ABC transporter permease [Actinomycetota bacterium]